MLVQKIKDRVDRVVSLRDEINLLDNTQISFDEGSVENFLLEIELNKNFHTKNLEMYNLIGELIREGCIIKSLEPMEIDFYSKLNMRDIAFCWQPKEENIKYWHYLNESCEKRKPIKIIERDYVNLLKKLR